MQFELNERQGDGAALRVHLQRLSYSTGKDDPRLHLHCPPAARGVWRAFCQMGREQGLGGPQRISSLEIDAWQRLHGIRLSPWELDCIYALDTLALEAASKDKK